MALEQESRAYREIHLPRLLTEGKVGKYALVKGEALIGVYNTFDEALQVGYDRWLHEDIFIKQIVEKEEPRYFSRNIRSCP